jgi:hypothetical protein
MPMRARKHGAAVDGPEYCTDPFEELVPSFETRFYSGSVQVHALRVITQQPLQTIRKLSLDRRSDIDVEVDALATAVAHLY